MQVQFGNTKIEANGAFVFIKAFGREIFLTREAGHSLKPYLRRHTEAGDIELWGAGLYAVVSPRAA